jgi:hypothetical protein
MGVAVKLPHAIVLTLAAAGAMSAFTVACGEVSADPVTTSGFTPAFGTDAGLKSTRVPPVQCPSKVQENDPCPRPNGVCEMGASPDPRCNAELVCKSDPTYGLYWSERIAPECPLACPDPSAIVDGAPCDVGAGAGDEVELHCGTPRGTCICTTGRDGAHAHARRWACATPAPGCPAKRPLLGQPCYGPQTCDYGACISKRGRYMFCEDDVWQTEVGPCAD